MEIRETGSVEQNMISKDERKEYSKEWLHVYVPHGNIYQLSDLTGANATPMPTTAFGTSHMQFVGPTFHVQSVGRIPIPHHHRQDKDQAPLKDVCLDRVKEDKKRMAASQSDAVATTSEAWIGFQKNRFEIVSELFWDLELINLKRLLEISLGSISTIIGDDLLVG